MSKPDWQWPLAEGETLLWQGRPAPRCYTFRNWKFAAAGTALFLACSFWMMLGLQLEETGASTQNRPIIGLSRGQFVPWSAPEPYPRL